MFRIKTFFKKNILSPKFLFPKNFDKFPGKQISPIRIKARIFALENELREYKKHSGIGNLLTYPHKEAIKIWQRLLPYNPNNLGNWSILNLKPDELFGTRIFEREVILKMIDLYHGDKQNLEGYITSGGTEANIFSSWIGRKYLEKKGVKKEKICLIKTSLTHYSIEKSADIIGVSAFITPLNEKTWGMDVESLEKTIKKLYQKGFRGFLLPLTLGYTLTGTVDSYKKICQKIRKIKKELKSVKFFIWIDAALNGLIEPFLNKKFSPFAFPEIQTFLVDFHKFGFVPYPAGIVLYRRNLRKLIEKPIDYLKEKDNTVLGSRNGISSVACWVVIHSLGSRGYKKIIDKCLTYKKTFLKQINNLPNYEIVTHPRSVSGGIILKSSASHQLTRFFEKKYGFYPANIVISFSDGKKQKKIIYKFFFLPNIKKETVKDSFETFRKKP